MNANAELLRQLMAGAGLTRQQTADLLYVSLDTVHSWLKPEGNRSGHPAPAWAVELLAYKTKQPVPDVTGPAATPEPA